MTLPQPVDQAARERISSSLGETLYVEAGAGTGKTTALVSRIVSLIVNGEARIDGIAAITFTEMAAAELRQRVRDRLENASRDPEYTDEQRTFCAESVAGMDSASIQTLHSFAGALLRERPLEAGLPPGFDVVEEIESDLNLQERWEGWLDAVLDREDLAPVILRALDLGLRFDQLREVAKRFHENYDLLDRPFGAAAAPPKRIVGEMAAFAGDASRLLPLSKIGPDDPLHRHVSGLVSMCNRIASNSDDYDYALSVLRRRGKLTTSSGRQPEWAVDAVTGVNGCKLLKDTLKDLEEAKTAELDGVRRACLVPILEDLRQSVLSYVEHRKRSGRAEFHDLLVWARDLLRDDVASRRYFQQRFSHILIDEFQDTDPIQAEIAFFLAEDPSRSGPSNDWTQVTVKPGKLFVVGDPKQSIYRFRRADIAALEQVKGLVGGETVSLVQNFRSQRAVIDWVNGLFESWMGPDGDALQAAYEPLSHIWDDDSASPSFGVLRMGGQVAGGANAARRQEAEFLAALVQQAISEEWQVSDSETDGKRPARYQDICVLLPSRANQKHIERAFDAANIAYRIESQSLVLATQDVRDILTCLRAIDSPADQIALIAALRSSIFGCSDVELLAFADSGGVFSILEAGDRDGPVSDALRELRKFHEDRIWEPPDLLIEGLVRQRRLIELSFGRPRPRERWRRIRFVIDQARAFAHVGGTSLRAFLDWMQRQADEDARMVEVPVPESDEDAVRVMTVHASKGLEFPIVVLTGLGTLIAQPVRARVLFDRNERRTEVRIGSANTGAFETAGFEALSAREKAADEAERVRLWYVASTRAKDRLVLSLFRSGSRPTFAEAVEGLMEDRSGLWSEIVPVAPPALVTESPALDTGFRPDTAEDRDKWLENRKQVVRVAARPQSRSVTYVTGVLKDEANEDETYYRSGRGSTQVGRAVHSVLQKIDLASPKRLLEPMCRQMAARHNINGRWREVMGLVEYALQSETVVAAIQSKEYSREVYVCVSVGGTLLEGFVDLIYRERDGLTIVDYKTDDIDLDALAPRDLDAYKAQVGGYALAVQQATGLPVKKLVLLFLRSRRARVYENTQELMDSFREAFDGAAAL